MGLIRDKGKSESEKLKEQQALQDSLSTNKLEAGLINQRQEEQEATRNQLLDPEKDKNRFKQVLLNVEPVEVPQTLVYCLSCGQDYKDMPEQCSECGNQDGFEEKDAGTTIRWVKRTDDSLLNREGFHKVVWSQLDPKISSSVAGGYLKNSEIAKLNYSTLSTITMQLALYPWKYGVSNPTDMQEIGDIVRSPLIAHTSKARGGRGLKSTEKTVVEKISKAFTEEEEDEQKGIF